MDERTQKLRRAKTAMQYLKQAIDALENPNNTFDPDYDLWSAYKWLKQIQDSEEQDSEEVKVHFIEVTDAVPPPPETGFSLFGDLK